MAQRTIPDRSAARRRRVGLLLGVSAALLVWLAAGLRTLDPEREFGVLEGGRFGPAAFSVDGSWVLAPPGLLSLTRYPRHAVELPLPGASVALVPGPDGGRYGLDGWATVRFDPQQWKKIHEAAAGEGAGGVLVTAMRRADLPLPLPWRRSGTPPPQIVERLSRQLAAALEAEGAELRGLQIAGYDPLAVGSGAGAAAIPQARVLLIGLDGADWDILDPLLAAGRMPNLAALIDGGVRAKLRSISPMLSPVIWTTMITGVQPSRHGILDFLIPAADGGVGEPVTSHHRQAAALWQILSRSDVPVGVVGWWASWPAEEVNGYLVSDRVAYQLFGYEADASDPVGKVWPPEIYATSVEPTIVDPSAIGWDRVEPFLGGDRRQPGSFDEDETDSLDEFRTLLASGSTYLDLAVALREQFDPRFEAVYFEGTDTIGHLFMRYRPPAMPGVNPAGFSSFSGMVDRYYEAVDGYLGRLLAGRGDEWTVLIVSDHGFVADEGRPQTTDSRIGHGAAADWHRRFGVLVASGANIAPAGSIGEASIYDVAPTILALFGLPVPLSWPGQTLGSALDPEFLERYPVRYRLDEPEHAGAQGLLSAVDQGASDVIDKLTSLGYIAAGEEGTVQASLSALNNTGVSFLSEGRAVEAEEVFREALTDQPNHPAVLVNLGVALTLQGRDEEAAEVFRKALDFPASRAAAGHKLAELALRQGDLSGAEARLRQVLEWEPGSAETHTTLGLVLEGRGQRDAAGAEYRRAAELDPDAAVARSNLGNLAKQSGDLDAAERWYREAIDADPYFMGAYNNLALLLQDMGRPELAIELYYTALDKAPGHGVVLNNLASLHYARGEFEEAERLWRRAIRSDDDYPSPYNNLAGLAISRGRMGEAEQLLEQALTIDPDYGDARINLSLVLRSRGETDAAREQLEQALTDANARGNALIQLGLLELEAGRLEQAAEWLVEARETDRTNTTVLNALGQSFWLSGQQEQAVGLWRESLAIDPAQPQLARQLEQLQR